MHRRHRVLALALAGFAATLLALPGQAARSERTQGYVVVLNDSVARPDAVASDHARRIGRPVETIFRHALKGYVANLTEADVSSLQADTRVAYVELDAPVEAWSTQTGATWGLDRIDQRNLPLSGTYSYVNTGAGVKAYIIDTGIRFAHAEFGGRATSGYDAVDGGSADDCNGHGTHVAGTTGGSRYGVAKSVSLVAVRVLDCGGSGTISGVIAGVDWVTGNHVAGQPAVGNMSLGGGASSALDSAVNNSIADGVSYAGGRRQR